MVDAPRSSNDVMQCTQDPITCVSRMRGKRRAAGMPPSSDTSLIKYGVLCSFTTMVGKGVHRNAVGIHNRWFPMGGGDTTPPCKCAHTRGVRELVVNIARALTCMEYMSCSANCNIHANRGLVNRNPHPGRPWPHPRAPLRSRLRASPPARPRLFRPLRRPKPRPHLPPRAHHRRPPRPLRCRHSPRQASTRVHTAT